MAVVGDIEVFLSSSSTWYMLEEFVLSFLFCLCLEIETIWKEVLLISYFLTSL